MASLRPNAYIDWFFWRPHMPWNKHVQNIGVVLVHCFLVMVSIVLVYCITLHSTFRMWDTVWPGWLGLRQGSADPNQPRPTGPQLELFVSNSGKVGNLREHPGLRPVTVEPSGSKWAIRWFLQPSHRKWHQASAWFCGPIAWSYSYKTTEAQYWNSM